MKYLHFLNGLAYDSMPPAPCQEKIYDLRKRAGGGAQGGFGTRAAAGRTGHGGRLPPRLRSTDGGAAAMLRAGGGRPSAVRGSFRPI